MIFSRIGIQAAFMTAMTLYPTRDEAIAAVARELCTDTGTVEAALAPEMIQ